MSRVLFLFTFILSLVCLDSFSSEKTKIMPENVHVNSEGIFVCLGGEWIPVQIIQEENGLTIEPFYEEISWGFAWRCNCQTWNFGSDTKCRECGKGRYDYSGG